MPLTKQRGGETWRLNFKALLSQDIVSFYPQSIDFFSFLLFALVFFMFSLV